MLLHYYGTDSYRLRLELRRATEHADSVTRVDIAADGGAEALERQLKYPSLFYQTPLVMVSNILARAECATTMLELLERYSVPATTDSTVIAIQEGDMGRDSAATKKLRTYLNTHAAKIVTCTPLIGPEQTAWVQSFCAERQCTIEPSALSALLQHASPDSWALANELEKLCAYSQDKPIDMASISALVSSGHVSDEWALSNAITGHNIRGAITALWQRLTNGASEYMIAGMLSASIRNLLATCNTTAYHPTQLYRAHAALATLDRSGKDGLSDASDNLFCILLDLSVKS